GHPEMRVGVALRDRKIRWTVINVSAKTPRAAFAKGVFRLKHSHRGQDEPLPDAGLRPFGLRGFQYRIAQSRRVLSPAKSFCIDANRKIVIAVLVTGGF